MANVLNLKDVAVKHTIIKSSNRSRTLVLSEIELVKKIKFIYIDKDDLCIKFSVLDTDTEILINKNKSKDIDFLFKYILNREIKNINTLSNLISDGKLDENLSDIFTYKGKGKDAYLDSVIDALDYFYARWLDNKELERDDFNKIAKSFYTNIISKNPYAEVYYKYLKRKEKCKWMYRYLTLKLMHRNIVVY